MTTIDTSRTLNGAQSQASQQLAGNFDTFLRLLTTQLQNQDPMSPMDSNEFTQQLVAFSGVEQQINTNDNLQSLIALSLSQQASAAVNYIGHNVVMTSGKGALENGAVDWTYNLSAPSSATALTVKDANGKVVYTTSGKTAAGNNDFAWDGKDMNGNQLPDGQYSLTVGATAADGSAVSSTIASKAVVTAVDMSGTTPMLVLGAAEIPLSEVSLVGSTADASQAPDTTSDGFSLFGFSL